MHQPAPQQHSDRWSHLAVSVLSSIQPGRLVTAQHLATFLNRSVVPGDEVRSPYGCTVPVDDTHGPDSGNRLQVQDAEQLLTATVAAVFAHHSAIGSQGEPVSLDPWHSQMCPFFQTKKMEKSVCSGYLFTQTAGTDAHVCRYRSVRGLATSDICCRGRYCIRLAINSSCCSCAVSTRRGVELP